ncbi:MAG: hypothetical protein AAFQ82_02840 [Myxococcota bacterium]
MLDEKVVYGALATAIRRNQGAKREMNVDGPPLTLEDGRIVFGFDSPESVPVSGLVPGLERAGWRLGISAFSDLSQGQPGVGQFWRDELYPAPIPQLKLFADQLPRHEKIMTLAAIVTNSANHDWARRSLVALSKEAAAALDAPPSLFEGKKKRSPAALLKTAASLFSKQTPFGRLAVLADALFALEGCNHTALKSVHAPVKTLIDTGVEESEPLLRERTLVICERFVYLAMLNDEFAAAAKHIDHLITSGPSPALQHARRFRIRLALGEGTYADDWQVFMGAIEENVAQTGSRKLLRSAKAFEADAFAHAAAYARKQGERARAETLQNQAHTLAKAMKLKSTDALGQFYLFKFRRQHDFETLGRHLT